MQKTQNKPATGELKISPDVIAAIARVAALEQKGVDSLASPPAVSCFFGNLFRYKPKKLGRQAISVASSDDFVTVSVSVNLKFGANITEVCAAVQNAVKDNVQTMTGMAVAKVNVMVAGITFPEEN
jgi:uncharacterized alkaline shock family protein YloU